MLGLLRWRRNQRSEQKAPCERHSRAPVKLADIRKLVAKIDHFVLGITALDTCELLERAHYIHVHLQIAMVFCGKEQLYCRQ